MAHQVRALTALPKSSHMAAHSHDQLQVQGILCGLWPLQAPSIQVVHRHRRAKCSYAQKWRVWKEQNTCCNKKGKKSWFLMQKQRGMYIFLFLCFVVCFIFILFLFFCFVFLSCSACPGKQSVDYTGFLCLLSVSIKGICHQPPAKKLF